MGIVKRVAVSAWFEMLFLLPGIAFRTFREERNVVPRERIKDITLGISPYKSELKYFTGIIKSKFGRGESK